MAEIAARYMETMQALGAPAVFEFSTVTVHWKASPFPNAVVLVHSRLVAPGSANHVAMSVAEAEELASLLTRAVEHARAYWKEHGIGPYE